MFKLPEDPAKQELERMIEMTRNALGPLTLNDVNRLREDGPWKQLGLSKHDWDSTQGLMSAHDQLERAVGNDYQRILELASGKIPQEDIDRITGKNIGREMLEKQFSAASVAREIEEQRLVKPPTDLPVPRYAHADPDPFRDGRERRQQREDEVLDLQRRSTAASEQAVRDWQLAALAAQEHERAGVARAQTETRRWQIGMFAVVAGLAIAAATFLWVLPTWGP